MDRQKMKQVHGIVDMIREQIAVGIFVTLLGLGTTISCSYCIKKTDPKSTASNATKGLTALIALSTIVSTVNLGKNIKYYHEERRLEKQR